MTQGKPALVKGARSGRKLIASGDILQQCLYRPNLRLGFVFY
jgi:hypothetical protein